MTGADPKEERLARARACFAVIAHEMRRCQKIDRRDYVVPADVVLAIRTHQAIIAEMVADVETYAILKRAKEASR